MLREPATDDIARLHSEQDALGLAECVRRGDVTPGELPLGTQFVGRIGDEATLLRLAGQLEVALPWRARRPPVSL